MCAPSKSTSVTATQSAVPRAVATTSTTRLATTLAHTNEVRESGLVSTRTAVPARRSPATAAAPVMITTSSASWARLPMNWSVGVHGRRRREVDDDAGLPLGRSLEDRRRDRGHDRRGEPEEHEHPGQHPEPPRLARLEELLALSRSREVEAAQCPSSAAHAVSDASLHEVDEDVLERDLVGLEPAEGRPRPGDQRGHRAVGRLEVDDLDDELATVSPHRGRPRLGRQRLLRGAAGRPSR